MADPVPERTGAAPRRRTARWTRALGWTALPAGFLLLVGALSKLTAGSGHTAASWTVLIVLAVLSLGLITAGVEGLHPGRPRRTPQH